MQDMKIINRWRTSHCLASALANGQLTMPWYICLQLLTLPLCPESPKHLLLDRDDEGRAETALKWLRGKGDVRGELGEMR